MTIFGGYFRLIDGRDERIAKVEEEFKQALFDLGADTLQFRRDSGLFVAWHDCEAFPDKGVYEDENRLLLLAGDPLYGEASTPRSAQAATLATNADTLVGELSRCPGMFSLLLLNGAPRRLLLATDSLGLRPVYYALHGGALYFSSCLTVLARMSFLRATVSASALFERIALGYNLDGKTPYKDIRVLNSAEYLDVSQCDVHVGQYWRWDQIKVINMTYAERVQRVYELFRQAIERRSWRASDAIAMLSGGLDSRMNVSVLRQLDKRVIAINCAPPGAGLKDEIYASRVASELGCELIRVSFGSANPDWADLAKQGLRLAAEKVDPSVSRIVFSGDGGSVGLGLVYYDLYTIELLRRGKDREVVERYLKRSLVLPDRYLMRSVSRAIHEHLRATIYSFLDKQHCEPGRKLHLFLLLNDQRTHLHGYLENIAIYKHEIVTPFFDFDLLRFVLACPVDDFVGHKLYHDLLQYLPESARQVPWQTYPGHLPCPVAGANDGVSQFSEAGQKVLDTLGADRRRLISKALSAQFPSPPFRRMPVLAISVAARLGWRRFDYVHRAVEAAESFFRLSEGRFDWDV